MALDTPALALILLLSMLIDTQVAGARFKRGSSVQLQFHRGGGTPNAQVSSEHSRSVVVNPNFSRHGYNSTPRVVCAKGCYVLTR